MKVVQSGGSGWDTVRLDRARSKNPISIGIRNLKQVAAGLQSGVFPQLSLKLFELDSQNVSESVLAISPLRVPAPGIDTGLTTPIAPASLPPASLDSTSAGTDQLPEVRRAIVEGNTEAAPQTRLPAEPNPAGVKTRASDLVPGEVVHQVLPYVPQKARDTL